MDSKTQELIYALIDGTISEDDFEVLQNAIEQDDEVRQAYLRSVNLVDSLADLAIRPDIESTSISQRSETKALPSAATSVFVTAALVLLTVGPAAYWIGAVSSPGDSSAESDSDAGIVRVGYGIAGHATLRRTVDAKWAANSQLREGHVLTNQRVSLLSGTAEIDFFCGASLIVEGPAEFSIESDWEVSFARGRLRANVPPAARGFTVVAAGSKIVDLGTEFAAEIEGSSASVQVVEGEIAFRGGALDGKHLFTGESESLGGGADSLPLAGLSTSQEIERQRQATTDQRLVQLQQHAATWSADPRTIAHFPIATTDSGFFRTNRTVANTASRDSSYSGLLIGPVSAAPGRFGEQAAGLEFERPGARVRTRIDGTFSAFTFVCWARIDSLHNRYNALFMGDGYENGEPHWQIRDDGSLMFSVMVDDTQDIRTYNEREKRMVQQAGLHRVYYSKPFWDVAKAGQWFHLATVYDPAQRRVRHFVNGEPYGDEEIIDKFYIKELHIGASEIGNWGQPFRKSPWFSVRNLNGVIDELLICDGVLSGVEISELYEQGKPVGY